jgi:hypothetical protein
MEIRIPATPRHAHERGAEDQAPGCQVRIPTPFCNAPIVASRPKRRTWHRKPNNGETHDHYDKCT